MITSKLGALVEGLDGRPVAYGLADPTPAGLVLAGGPTLPAARGCYRALVRARWEEAVRLGTAGLALQAQYGTAASILRRLRFVEVAQIHTLKSTRALPRPETIASPTD